MPTYQYACTQCGHAFEQYQSFSEDSLKVCPECGGELRKVFNSVGVVFKGSGFYKTDSRSGSSASVPASKDSGSTTTTTESASPSTSTSTPASTSSSSSSTSGSTGASSSAS